MNLQSPDRNFSRPLIKPRVPHVLIVDDDNIMRMMLREALQHQGYAMNILSNVEEALEILIKDPDRVDVLVLDRELKGMSGLELMAAMKEDARLSAIPVIMLTGSGTPEEIWQGIDAGVFRYLVKPVGNALLKNTIESALHERALRKARLDENG